MYGAVCLVMTAFFGLFLLDTAVLIRWGDGISHATGFSLAEEYHRLVHVSAARWTEMLANVAVFFPFGLFLSEFLASAKRFSAERRLWLATLAGFSLSLCIECFQLLLRVGFFELTDLVMNTLGTLIGAGVAVLIRRLLHSPAFGRKDNKKIPSHWSE